MVLTAVMYRHALQLAYANQAELIMLHVIKPVGAMGEELIKEYSPADLVDEVHREWCASGYGENEDQSPRDHGRRK